VSGDDVNLVSASLLKALGTGDDPINLVYDIILNQSNTRKF